MRTLAKLIVVLALFGVTVVAALGAADPELAIPVADDHGGPIAAGACALFVVCVLALRRRPALAPHDERRTQFGMSAVDPTAAEQHVAAWERPLPPPCASARAPYYAPQPQYYAQAYPVAPSSPPVMPPTWFDVMPATPTAAPYQATLEHGAVAPAAGATTIGYAAQPPSSYDETPLFVRPERAPGDEFDDDGATQFQPSYQRYVEEQHEAHQRLARGSQPPGMQPHAEELLDVTHAFRKR